ncbi:MAG: hypothetical protein M3005_05825 [Apilactobacillus sp.]|uniref:hypothetical protein n=1 Tax=Apilactobacillus sp. TaxID=2767901 RepID=UPI0025EE64A0|nr:hypothetical protein [Apilactobacillus sp.]MCT6823382.1 hypothetical protein [Apilactobacillus sp.]
MKPVLIIIRGNKSSGKSTLAVRLQEQLGVKKTFLIQPSSDDDTQTMTKLAQYGQKHFEYVVIEGELPTSIYMDSIKKIIKMFGEQTLVYYLNLTLDQTIELDQQRAEPYGKEQLVEQFQPYDQINELENQLDGLNLDEKIDRITEDINKLPLF